MAIPRTRSTRWSCPCAARLALINGLITSELRLVLKWIELGRIRLRCVERQSRFE